MKFIRKNIRYILIALGIVILLLCYANYHDKQIYAEADRLIEEKRYDEVYPLIKKIYIGKHDSPDWLRLYYVTRYARYYGEEGFKECIYGLDDCAVGRMTDETLASFSDDQVKIREDCIEYYFSTLERVHGYDRETATKLMGMEDHSLRTKLIFLQIICFNESGIIFDDEDLSGELSDTDISFKYNKYKR